MCCLGWVLLRSRDQSYQRLPLCFRWSAGIWIFFSCVMNRLSKPRHHSIAFCAFLCGTKRVGLCTSFQLFHSLLVMKSFFHMMHVAWNWGRGEAPLLLHQQGTHGLWVLHQRWPIHGVDSVLISSGGWMGMPASSCFLDQEAEAIKACGRPHLDSGMGFGDPCPTAVAATSLFSFSPGTMIPVTLKEDIWGLLWCGYQPTLSKA